MVSLITKILLKIKKLSWFEKCLKKIYNFREEYWMAHLDNFKKIVINSLIKQNNK